nr:MAG TPA: hypothetical protein [Caudoviricetes sp.]
MISLLPLFRGCFHTLARYYLLSRVLYTLDRRLSYEAYSPMDKDYNCHIASLI